jgi:nucleoside-diphosphate kinase
MVEKTLAIIKPDAVQAGSTEDIINLIEKNNFLILGIQQLQLTKKQAEEFYAIHEEKPFFNELVSFMTSGPIVVLALEKDRAIADWRKLMGDTDPVKAEERTIRKLYGTDIGNNAAHGSDSAKTAKGEIKFFFPQLS